MREEKGRDGGGMGGKGVAAVMWWSDGCDVVRCESRDAAEM